MDNPKLKAKLMVQALVRRCGAEMIPAYVTRRGDADSGAVLIKRVTARDACVVFQMAFGEDGQRQWILATGDDPVMEMDADAFLERQAKYDEDLWVVEVEAAADWLPAVDGF